MAGNPFRRAQGTRLPELDTGARYDAEADAFGLAEAPPTKPKSKKKKKVVIQTPPHSPEEPRTLRRLSDGGTGSPPPPPIALRLDEEDTDSTTAADSDLEQALANTRRNSGSLPPPPASSFGQQATSKAPYNPFARTLATSEAAYGTRTSTTPETRDEQGATRSAGAGRTVMDVDAFKNMLLTGSAAPTPKPAPPTQPPKTQDSSSNTDTSSLSRRSIFDNMQEAHPESPRTSAEYYDRQSHSEDSDSGDDDTEHSSLMGPIESRPIEEGPQAPPKPKQGRSFPQTVSFADFDESMPSYSSSSSPRTPPASVTGILRPSPQRSPSDVNKPLPPPPSQPDSSFDHTTSTIPEDEPQGTSHTHSVLDQRAQTKAPPPPPPVSRRQGQSNIPGRHRSASNLSQSSLPGGDGPIAVPQSPDPTTKFAPPPPPSRRAQPVPAPPATSRTPSADTSTTTTPIPTTITTPASPAETKSMPPPPPRRFSSTTNSSKSRTPSFSAHNPALSNDTPAIPPLPHPVTSSPAPTISAAPAPPPPRRTAIPTGAPKRSSIDGQNIPPISTSRRTSSGADPTGRRSSRTSFESDRSFGARSRSDSTRAADAPPVPQHARSGARASVSSPSVNNTILETSAAVSSEQVDQQPPQRDILADMVAFQAEIDAMRAASAAGTSPRR